KVGKGANAPGLARHDQAELAAGVRHAPADVLGAAFVERMAEDDLAAPVAQTGAGALWIGAPVDLERSAELLTHKSCDGHIESLGRAVGCLAGPRHGSRLGTKD